MTPSFGSVDEAAVPVPAVRFGGGRGQGMPAGSVDADSTSHDWPTADDGAVVSGRSGVVLTWWDDSSFRRGRRR
jgi:hypothetical protein